MKEHNYEESALLEILHRAQDIYGFLDKELLMDISQSLNLPPSHVFGVATFYSFFKLKRTGQHVVTGCLGTACYVKGVDEIMRAIEGEYNIFGGEIRAVLPRGNESGLIVPGVDANPVQGVDDADADGPGLVDSVAGHLNIEVALHDLINQRVQHRIIQIRPPC